MSTTRVVRYSVEDATDPTISPTFSQFESGNSWSVNGTTYTSQVQNGVIATKLAVWTFTQDFRKQDPVYGISQNRCIVKLRCAPVAAGSGFPPAGENAGGFFGSIRWQNTYSGNFGNPPFGFTDRFQTGSDVTTTTANVNEINGLELAYRAGSATTTNSNGLFQQAIQISNPRLQGNTGLAGSLFFSWEANNHAIDGLNGDNSPVITTQCFLIANAGVNRFASSNVSVDCSLSENSISVITGVEKTLENNFSLSAVGQVKYAISKTLTQETELFGTTFNFRFADPLTISTDCSLANTIALKRGFGANLIIDADANANFTGNMIYDNSDEYSWNDFNILGYAISGYAVAGYVTDSADYSWLELDPVTWDTWTNAVWGGQEASWETWPEEVWNSTRTLLSLFTSQQAANLIASGVAQLLSSTSLSDNSAFRIEGVPAEIRSDFLCDGSPSGLIGGLSTITQDSILSGLANYIINNAQNIDGAFNATLLANYIATFLWQAQSDFNLTVSPTFKPSGVTNAQCITVVNALANAIYGPTKTLQGAFDPEFIARLFVGTDPYLIHKLLQETRQIFVDAESRGIQIAQEIRLNSIPAEDRDYLVPQETRSMKLRIPPMTNRFTTPKVRTE
jgi:hypothetical protein